MDASCLLHLGRIGGGEGRETWLKVVTGVRVGPVEKVTVIQKLKPQVGSLKVERSCLGEQRAHGCEHVSSGGWGVVEENRADCWVLHRPFKDTNFISYVGQV